VVEKNKPLKASYIPMLNTILAFLLFALAAYYRNQDLEGKTVAAWGAALVLLSVWGLRDWWKNKHYQRRDILIPTALTLFALLVRVMYDPRTLPGYVYSDEVLLVVTTKWLAEHLTGMLNLFWVGIPIFEVLPQALVYYVIGDALSPVLLVRVVSGVFGALSVLGLYILGRSLVNERVGVAAAILLAVAHTSINYSRVALPFIQTSTFALFFMALTIRAIKGGSYINWVGAAMSFGFGVMSYQAAYIFPAAMITSILPFFIGPAKVKDTRRALAACIFILVFGAMIAAPPFLLILKNVPWESSRVAALLITPKALTTMEGARIPTETFPLAAFRAHVANAFGIFWWGQDGHPLYGARYPLVDPAVGALLFLAPLLFFRRPVTAWICSVWIVGYVTIGLVLCIGEVTYHRVLTSIGFVALAVTALVDSFLPRRAANLALGALCLLSAYLNLNWYFRSYPQSIGLSATSGLATTICPFSKTHTIVDATGPNGGPWGFEYHSALDAECGPLTYKAVTNTSELWNVVGTLRGKVLVITRTPVVAQIGEAIPADFVTVKKWRDDRISNPEKISLSVFDLYRQ
jgi:hypothetical protein